MTDVVLQVRQIKQYPQETSAGALDGILVQVGSVGGPYQYINAPDLVSSALINGGNLNIKPGGSVAWNGAQLSWQNGTFSFNWPVLAPVVSATQLFSSGDPVATVPFINDLIASVTGRIVNSFNGRSGDVQLETEDILRAGALPQVNPHMSGHATAPTSWNFEANDDTIATTAWVQGALCHWFEQAREIGALVTSFNGRGGNVVLNDQDITLAATAPGAAPRANTPSVGDYSNRIATTSFVEDAVLAGSPPGPSGPPGPAGLPGAQGPPGPVGGGAINVNSLTTIPLVGDGVTDNYAAWQQIQGNLQNLTNDWPVNVTLTAGSPAVVNLTAHGLKPNQAFRFTMSSGGLLPPEITAGTIYYVTAANIAANTFTFSATPNPLYVRGQAEGATVTTSSPGSNVQIVLLSNQWINLYVPPGAYATHTPFGAATTRTAIELFPMGISRVRITAYGAVFDDLWTPSPTGTASAYMASPGPAPNGWVLQSFDYINSVQQRIGLGGPWNVTLQTIANAVNYYVGQWVVFLGIDLQNQLGKFSSGPPNNQYAEYNQIISVNTGTGVIGFKYPFKFMYSDTWPNMYNGFPGFGTTGGGSGIGGGQVLIAPMNPSWDMEYEIVGARFAFPPISGLGRRQTYIDCTWDRGFAPHVGKEIYFKRCKLMSNQNQIDKMMEYLEFEDCEVYAVFSSASVLMCRIKGCRGTLGTSGTPRNIEIENSVLEQITIGVSALGVTDSVVIRNTRTMFFDKVARSDQPNGGASGANAVLANWTFTNGTLSRDLSTVAQNLTYQPWAVPGAKCFLSDEGRVYDNMGSPFAVLNTYITGTAIGFPSGGAYGSGGTPGPVVLTVVGGTGTAATINATINSSGSLFGSTFSVASGGNYTVFPAQPAAVTGGGLTGATVFFAAGTIFNVDTTLRAIPTIQGSINPITVTIASPAVFTCPAGVTAPANGTQILLQTTGALPTGFTPNYVPYYVVGSSGTVAGTFNLATTSGGTAINSSGTQSGVHTAITNPLHINPHPCPRFTGIGNSGTQAIVDLNGAIDEPIFSRFKRGFVARQFQFNEINFQGPTGRIWGNLISLTINVYQAATGMAAGAYHVTITCPGFTQPGLVLTPLNVVVDLTVAGTRTITSTAVTGSAGADALGSPYANWLCGSATGNYANSLSILPGGTLPTTIANGATFDVEVLTDQGLTRFATMFGQDASKGNAVTTFTDASMQFYSPISP